jgi:hypothetical protein
MRPLPRYSMIAGHVVGIDFTIFSINVRRLTWRVEWVVGTPSFFMVGRLFGQSFDVRVFGNGQRKH